MSGPSAILVADVGGTNTRAALAVAGAVQEAGIRRYRNAQFESLGQVLERYLAESNADAPEAVCVAVAGPVRDGWAQMTNLAWTIEPEGLIAATGAARAFVLNDLEAQGHALDGASVRNLMPGARVPQGAPGAAEAAQAQAAAYAGPRLVVGVGTGFNAAPVHGSGATRHVAPSECGHMSLPVWDDASHDVAAAIARDRGFADVEEVCSGRGLERLYRHFAGPDGESLRSAQIVAALQAEPGGGAPSPAARAARAFCGTLGRVVGDLALVHLPWDGIYLVGGMARAMAPFYGGHGFEEGFCDKGRFAEFQKAFPVDLVEDDYAALDGCTRYALARG